MPRPISLGMVMRLFPLKQLKEKEKVNKTCCTVFGSLVYSQAILSLIFTSSSEIYFFWSLYKATHFWQRNCVSHQDTSHRLRIKNRFLRFKMGIVIVITGATAGLGQSMCEYFIKESHKVIGCGRSKAKIDKLNEKYAEERAKFYAVDVSKDGEVEVWSKEVLKEYGPPDFLINNAGVVNENQTLWNISSQEFDKVIDVNIKGPVNCIRHFVPSMVKAERGVIVNFSSTWGKSVSPEVAPYCCSKWGIEGLSKAMALELPAPLVCVPLNPGVINTDMLQTIFGESAQRSMSPEQWIRRAGPLILSIDRSMNGRSLDVNWMRTENLWEIKTTAQMLAEKLTSITFTFLSPLLQHYS